MPSLGANMRTRQLSMPSAFTADDPGITRQLRKTEAEYKYHGGDAERCELQILNAL